MDYYYSNTCQHKNITCIKILKYLLLCTIVLLLIGLLTLFIQCLALVLSAKEDHLRPGSQSLNQLTSSQIYQNNNDLLLKYLLADHCVALVASLVAFTATIKENFFFLVTSATINTILSFINVFIPSYRLSIIFLQACSALFTFAYTLSMYFKMKFDIRRKKKVKKLEALQKRFIEGNLAAQGSNIKSNESLYRANSSDTHSYDKLMLTNEWLRLQQDASFHNQHSILSPEAAHLHCLPSDEALKIDDIEDRARVHLDSVGQIHI